VEDSILDMDIFNKLDLLELNMQWVCNVMHVFQNEAMS